MSTKDPRTGVRPVVRKPRTHPLNKRDGPGGIIFDHIMESVPTLIVESTSRQLYNVPKTPFYGYKIPSTPPYCAGNPLSENCQTPTEAPFAYGKAEGFRGPLLLTTCIGGFLILSLAIWCFYYMRRARREVLVHEQVQRQRVQLQTQSMSTELTEVIPEAERRLQMEGKLKLIRPEDIVALTDGGEEYHNACSICLNDFGASDNMSGSVNPDCRHYFHTDCILQAFLQRPRTHYDCPVCRRDFFQVSSSEDCKEADHPSDE